MVKYSNNFSWLKVTTITTCFFITTSLFPLSPLYGTELDLKKQQEMLSQQIKQNQSLLQSKKNEENKTYLELKAINNTLSKTSRQLKSTESQLYNLQQELIALEQELAKESETLENCKETLEERLIAIYQQGDVHILEVLFGSTTITDFLTRWDLLSRLTENNKNLISETQAKVTSIQEKQKAIEEKKQALATLKEHQNAQKRELAVASSRQQKLYSSVKSERAKLEQALNELEEQSRKIAEEIRRKTQGTTGQSLGTGTFTWPAPGYKRITSQYGMRYHPILKKRKLHTGMDIGAPKGANIVAADSGTVIQVGWNGGYGNTVMINHGNNKVTLYAHCSATLVSVGQTVQKGDVIAKVGSTGWSTGPHLHFEVRINGEPVNPTKYL